MVAGKGVPVGTMKISTPREASWVDPLSLLLSHAQLKVTFGVGPTQVEFVTLAEPQAGAEIPAPALCVHWKDGEATDNLTAVKLANIKIPEAINNPPKNIIAGIIIFLDKSLFVTD